MVSGRLIFLLTLLITLAPLKGQNGGYENNDAPFKAGEWFKFRIHYGFLNASYATVKLENTMLNGKEVYHARGYGRTTGIARLFFKVEDVYESYFDKQTIKPYRFVRNIYEGGYTKHYITDFDHEKQMAYIDDKKRKTKSQLQVSRDIQDMVSTFYFMRHEYRTANFTVGQEIDINMFYDDDETFKFKLKFLGREVIRTKFGKVRALKFRPYVQSGRVFKEKESLTVWVSDDKNKIPLRVKADLRIGAIKADLEAYSGLSHQFKILQN